MISIQFNNKSIYSIYQKQPTHSRLCVSFQKHIHLQLACSFTQ